MGFQALANTTTGISNNAFGYQALVNNTTGFENNAFGFLALGFGNPVTGDSNNAFGTGALSSITSGSENSAFGHQALNNDDNGVRNVAVGYLAGYYITGSGNVAIGASTSGGSGVDNTTWIKNVFASTAAARAVYVNGDDKIGTLSSSRRYKEEIKPMDKASKALFALKPVTFRYKKEVEPSGALSFGLIAEEVAEISSDLITCDKDGKPETVRYEAVNAMLLNEFLKEHKKVEEQQSTIAKLKSTVAQQQKSFQSRLAEEEKQMAALAWGLQNVSAQIEMSRPSSPVVVNKP